MSIARLIPSQKMPPPKIPLAIPSTKNEIEMNKILILACKNLAISAQQAPIGVKSGAYTLSTHPCRALTFFKNKFKNLKEKEPFENLLNE